MFDITKNNLTNNEKEEVKGMELKVNNNIRNWYEQGGCQKIKEFMDDVDGIFSTDNGYKAGIYGVYVVTPLEKEIPMYIGEVGREGRNFRERIIEHAKYWIENPKFYSGVKISELMNGYKYRIRILSEETEYDKRYALEQSLIEELKPYLQFSCYPKYESDYKGNDLAIFGTYRRRAFIVARDGKYTEEKPELFINNIYKLSEKVDFNDYKYAKPNSEVVELVEREMMNYVTYSQIKSFVDSKLGVISSRGCKWSYLIRIVAAALEPMYNQTKLTF